MGRAAIDAGSLVDPVQAAIAEATAAMRGRVVNMPKRRRPWPRFRMAGSRRQPPPATTEAGPVRIRRCEPCVILTSPTPQRNPLKPSFRTVCFMLHARRSLRLDLTPFTRVRNVRYLRIADRHGRVPHSLFAPVRSTTPTETASEQVLAEVKTTKPERKPSNRLTAALEVPGPPWYLRLM
jgi:hypothetical protein